MTYYQLENHTLVSDRAFPFTPIPGPEPEKEILWAFRRAPLTGRETFAVTDTALLTEREGIETLDAGALPPVSVPPTLAEAVAAGRVRGVNLAHPRWRELLSPSFPACRPEKKLRLHLLALGDVGATLALGLRLLGGDVLSAIGVCDLREGVARRWEFELNQIGFPDRYGDLPPVEEVDVERIFDCDVFLFCASRFVPDTAVKTGDVRMAQYEANRPLAARYGRMAREKGFRGLFCVVSDPVDPLCRAALDASNRNEAGELDFLGLFPHQVRGFGLGVMNARAAYYAKKEVRFADFLTDGRTFGPHGEDLVAANSISRYDDALSRELTERTAHANLEMRQMGFKPYVAPAMSSGALSVLGCLRGEWHCSSVYLNGVFFGVRNRLTAHGPEVERLPLPGPLAARLEETMEKLRAIPVREGKEG